MKNGLNWLDWICVASYSLALLGIAVYHSRKLKRQDDIFLAGRSMKRWPIAISMYMALFSTNSLLGTTGWVNRSDGTIWIALQTVGILFAVPLVVWLYPALFFRLRITSAYEYLDKRFNHSVRTSATAFFLAARFMWMATILYSSSLLVSIMLGWTPANGFPNGELWAICIIATLATLFALLGGMHAVIWTDVMQFFVLMAGLTVMIFLGLHLSGGLVRVITIGRQFGRFKVPSAFSLTDRLSLSGGLLLGFIGMLSSAGADQVMLQQYLTASSEREAKAALWRSGFFVKPLSFIYPFLGLIMFAFYRTHNDVARLMRIPDDALPVFVMNVMPAGTRGLMTIAMVASVLTAVQSGMAAVSAAIQVNFVKPKLRRQLSERELVLLARILLLLIGICILAIACWVRKLGQQNSVLNVLNIIVYPFSGVLLGTFLLGILSHRANSRGVLIGGTLGLLGTVALPASGQFFAVPLQMPALEYLGRISNFYYGFIATFLTVIVGYAVSMLFSPPPAKNIEGLTRRSLPQPAKET